MGNFCADNRDRDEANQDENQTPLGIQKEDQALQPLSATHKKAPVSNLAASEKATPEEIEAFYAGPAGFFAVPPGSGILEAIKSNGWHQLARGDDSIEFCKAQLTDLAGRPYLYFGQMKNGAKHGNGQVYFTDATGELVVCSFNADSADGEGVVYFADGTYFKGVLAGQQLSQGTLVVPNRYTYKGAFINNKPSGHGQQLFTDGRSYEGDFRDGVKEGKGTFKWPSGDTYTGDWLNGKQHGHGVLVKGGKSIEGDFFEGKKVKST